MADIEFSNKLKNMRLKAKYSQKDVCEHFGIPQSTFSSWETGKSEPSGKMLLQLCEFYNCDFLEEFSSDNDLSYKEWKVIEKYRFIKESSPNGTKTIDTVLDGEYVLVNKLLEKCDNFDVESSEELKPTRIISYYQRLASAGNGQVVFEDMPVDRIEIPDIQKYKRVAYAISVNGRSMEPLFEDGDILLIEPTCDISVGEIGIFIVGSESFVKKLGEGELISLNKGHENIALTEDSKCMGRVVDNIKPEM